MRMQAIDRIPQWLMLGILVAGIGCGKSGQVPGVPAQTSSSPYAPSDIGTLVTSVSAEGWLNGEGVEWSSLQGQVVVLDIWAYW